MGHLGLTPQSFNVMGGHKVQALDVARILDDACALEAASKLGLVLEGVPAEVAARITQGLHIPTIGIGAGVGCDGQVLVIRHSRPDAGPGRNSCAAMSTAFGVLGGRWRGGATMCAQARFDRGPGSTRRPPTPRRRWRVAAAGRLKRSDPKGSENRRHPCFNASS